jgi:glycine cleavage system aminomethyltransferase T/glycine/D-amino acid oxidase-like deaminating enzyme
MADQHDLPAETETLVVGAGVVGCATAYYLAAAGRDVTVVDRGPLPESGGTSGFAPSGVFQTTPDRTRARLAARTRDLAADCDAFVETGSIELATTDDRFEALERRLDYATAWGVEGARLLDADGVAERASFVDADAVEGGYYVPGDGYVETVALLAALQRRAADHGATFHGHTGVTDVETDRGAVTAVETAQGTIRADDVVLASGVWTPVLSEMAGVDLPLAPAVHQYAVTESLSADAGADDGTGPWLRHPEAKTYARPHGDAFGIGSYDHDPELVDPEDIADPADADEQPRLYDYAPGTDADERPRPLARPFTESAFESAHESMSRVVPALDGASVAAGVDGLIGVTPDGGPVVGETPQVDGLWVAAGVRTEYAGGLGQVLADLMETGATDLDVDGWHVARLMPHSSSPSFVRRQGAETYRSTSGVPEPASIETTGETVRESPFYRYQEEQGADFYDLRYGGWKRPMRFERNESLLDEYEIPPRAGRSDDHDEVAAAEHLAVRDGVGMADLTSFTTFDVVGPNALEFCQRAFSNDVDIPVGGVTYTLMLDESGGIHGDMTVVRRAHDRFHVISNSGGAGTKQIATLKRRAAGQDGVFVADKVGARCGLAVSGPDAREMLDPVVEADLDNESFPFFSATETYVGSVPVLAVRVSYVGELGWEFHTSMEYGAQLWQTLWEAGEDYDLTPFGDGALVTLRLEKGFPAYGVDVSPAFTPLEADLAYTVDFETDFVGRDALREQRDAGLDRKRAVMTLDDPDAVVASGSPVLDDDGSAIGHLTSAGEAYHIDEFVVYGYVPPEYTDPGTGLTIQCEGDRYAATVVEAPLFDPENRRMITGER